MIEQISSDDFVRQFGQLNNAGSSAQSNSAPQGVQSGGEFKEILGNLISDVDEAQKVADLSLESLAKGENTSIQEVVMKMEEADLSFKLVKEVRNTLLEAYKEIMQMQA